MAEEFDFVPDDDVTPEEDPRIREAIEKKHREQERLERKQGTVIQETERKTPTSDDREDDDVDQDVTL